MHDKVAGVLPCAPPNQLAAVKFMITLKKKSKICQGQRLPDLDVSVACIIVFPLVIAIEPLRIS